jgi:hypothetical protein
MIERETLGFLLRSHVTPERVGAIVAAAFELPETEVAVLDYEKDQALPVLLQIISRDRGFRTDVTVFVERERCDGIDSLALAQRVAPLAADDVLVSPPSTMTAIASNPYNSILIKTNGERFVATETEPESGSVVVDERPAALRQL